jgi:hypothetical protein
MILEGCGSSTIANIRLLPLYISVVTTCQCQEGSKEGKRDIEEGRNEEKNKGRKEGRKNILMLPLPLWWHFDCKPALKSLALTATGTNSSRASNSTASNIIINAITH